jgi:hypoxanthine phosphoribosyltransferase
MSSRPKVLVDRNEIANTVARLASDIRRDYQGKQPVLIGVLKGSFIFMADLVRQLDLPVELDFATLSSYGSSEETSSRVKLVRGLTKPIRHRHVIVVEDIVDTGLSVSFLLGYLKEKKPASIRLCALMDKPSRRRVPVPIDYLGFTLPDKFVVGYGLDLDERFRYLPDICLVEE